ncbi:hypothetical protein CHARACLAT_014398 [Characodon lateralis]|uniref:Uncharacterized protein n=1 Tax=Characodon lateralis TaxID=208331 RepID=A0ABU7F582_9TELE|nr:hypothetical protein [Characodon lateralis]
MYYILFLTSVSDYFMLLRKKLQSASKGRNGRRTMKAGAVRSVGVDYSMSWNPLEYTGADQISKINDDVKPSQFPSHTFWIMIAVCLFDSAVFSIDKKSLPLCFSTNRL